MEKCITVQAVQATADEYKKRQTPAWITSVIREYFDDMPTVFAVFALVIIDPKRKAETIGFGGYFELTHTGRVHHSFEFRFTGTSMHIYYDVITD